MAFILRTGLWLTASMLALSGCDNRLQQAFAFCATNGALQLGTRPTAEGYLRARDLDYYFGFEHVVRELLEKRFTYIEVMHYETVAGSDGETFEKQVNLPMVDWNAIAGRKYVRYFIADTGNVACAAFEAEVRSYPRQKLPLLRRLGLPESLCIASVGTNESRSAFELRVTRERANVYGITGDWYTNYALIDRQSSQVLSKISTNGYRLPSADKRQPGLWHCDNEKDVERFKSEALIAVGDERLGPIARRVQLQDHPEFPKRFRLRGELVVASHDIAEIDSNEFGRREPGEVAGQGRIAFDHQSRQLHVIHDAVETIFPMDDLPEYAASIGPIVTKGDEFLVLARFGDRKYAGKFAVLRYRRDGKPLASYEVDLPPVALSGRYLAVADQIEVNDREVLLRIHDVTESPSGKKWAVLATYQFRAPLAASEETSSVAAPAD